MKVLVNATVCNSGSGANVSASFISKAFTDNNINYIFAVSSLVFNNLSKKQKNDTRIILFETSPAKLFTGKSSRKKLLILEKEFSPDIVFTVFGPAYVKFENIHLCGIADGWMTHRSKFALKSLSLPQKLYIILSSKYKQARLNPNDYYWVEADIAKIGLKKILNIDSSKIKVIPNNVSIYFTNSLMDKESTVTSNDKIVNLLYPAYPYPNKNHKIIPYISKYLKETDKNKNYTFIVTLPEPSNHKYGKFIKRFWERVNKLEVKDTIKNLGIIDISECVKWYKFSDIVFMPTFLETFSGVYIEAMFMGKPIITSDLDFSRSVCGDAAYYYNPESYKDAAKAIQSLTDDKNLRDDLVFKGYKKLEEYPNYERKNNLILNWLKEIIKINSV